MKSERTTVRIPVEPLTSQGFQNFGDVVEIGAASGVVINQGFAERFDGLANIDVATGGGAVNVSLFTARPRPLPIEVGVMERHPLGSQMFVPMQGRPWLALVCGDPADAASYRAFRASGSQGVNYARNVWHHPLLVFDADSLFLVVDRAGPGVNLEEFDVAARLRLTIGA